jgi:FkbH-like protein
MARDPSIFIFSVGAKDRFGDHGLIGVIILKTNGKRGVIDAFLLSCRVIGRNIEEAMVAFTAGFLRERGVKNLIGEFLPTAKNLPAAGLYQKLKFKKTTDTIFEANLEEIDFPFPPHIQMKVAVPSVR